MAASALSPGGRTVSIFHVLAALPSGAIGAPLTPEEMTRYLQQNYHTDGEKDRNTRHALRDELYRDGGTRHMCSFIDDVFKDPLVRDLRKKWVPYARFNNVIKRIVNELSTVYSEPAKRVVENGDDAYQRLLATVRMDERMVEASRLLNLHRAVLLGFRVRMRPSGMREPVIDIVTPANARAVLHPNDDTLVVGWMIRSYYKTARKQIDTAAWTLWTDHESFQLRDDLSVIGDTYQEHRLGVCPWVAVTLGPPAAGFWPGNEGEDLVAAHVAVWFNNVLLLKESKSATKQPVIQGDGTAMARGQAADTETAVELADGQSVTTVDMSMDLSLFRETTNHIVYGAGHNYGLSPAIIDHQGVQSAQARELMRMPIRELRRQQQVPWRQAEHLFAGVMSAVVAVDMPEFSFSPDAWRIEFSESETPLDPNAEMILFEKRRAAAVDNTVSFLMRKHPGLTEEGALEMIANNITVEVERNRLMRPLMEISGGLSASVPADGAAAEETGEESDTPADEDT